MQISIIDHGPIGAKVTIFIDGQSIAFPEHSFHQLINLMTLIGAARENEAKKGESHWTLGLEDVCSQAFQTAPLWKRIRYAITPTFDVGPE